MIDNIDNKATKTEELAIQISVFDNQMNTH